MSSEIEMEDLAARRPATHNNDVKDTPRGPRINMDANQEQAIATWAYAATIL